MAESHDDLIDLVYGLLFGRTAEPKAKEHWRPYLANGLIPLQFFEALWKSDEFKARADQSPYVKPPADPTAAKALEFKIITDAYFTDLIKIVEKDRNLLLEVGALRSAVARWRYRDLMQTLGLSKAESEAAVEDTVAYSALSLNGHVDIDRSNDMIRPLLSIGRVVKNVHNMKVLSIGPRTEMELFALLAAGFMLENILMLDLISYSPFIQVGDMHSMSYADNSFDLVVFGETLAYSTSPEIAVAEILRVAKHDAIIAIVHAATKGHVPLFGNKEELPLSERTGLFVGSTEDIIRFFRPHVGHVYLRCEPQADGLQRVVTIFDLEKKN